MEVSEGRPYEYKNSNGLHDIVEYYVSPKNNPKEILPEGLLLPDLDKIITDYSRPWIICSARRKKGSLEKYILFVEIGTLGQYKKAIVNTFCGNVVTNVHTDNQKIYKLVGAVTINTTTGNGNGNGNDTIGNGNGNGNGNDTNGNGNELRFQQLQGDFFDVRDRQTKQLKVAGKTLIWTGQVAEIEEIPGIIEKLVRYVK